MNDNQKEYLRNRIKDPTESKKQSALKAGYAETTAQNAKSKIEDVIKDDPEWIKLLEKHGLTDDFIAEKLKEGMDANLVKTATDKGKISDEKHYTDFKTRAVYIDLTLQLKDKYPAKKLSIQTPEPIKLVIEKKVTDD